MREVTQSRAPATVVKEILSVYREFKEGRGNRKGRLRKPFFLDHSRTVRTSERISSLTIEFVPLFSGGRKIVPVLDRKRCQFNAFIHWNWNGNSLVAEDVY